MSLKNIIGQDKALRILFGTLSRDRVPSAMLFSGDMGIGKRLAALNFAKAVNCLGPVDYDCCDECVQCRKIDSGQHPDVASIASEGDEIKIDTIRKVEEAFSFRALEGRKKVVILDDADAMNINAANAFLKTLEEPPPDSLILLVSSNPDRLPATIRSRCVNVRFKPLPDSECRELVSKNIKTGGADIACRLAMGRPGLAISRDFLKENEWFMDVLDAMLRGETKSAWADKGEIKSWLDLSFVFLRDMAIALEFGAGSPGLLMVPEQAQEKPTLRTGAAGLKTIVEAYQGLQRFYGLLDFNLNKAISWNYVAMIMQNLKIKTQN